MRKKPSIQKIKQLLIVITDITIIWYLCKQCANKG